MNVFVDTSALYAVLDQSDQNHTEAQLIWQDIFTRHMQLVTSNYVLLESSALLQHRFGMEAMHDFENAIVPTLSIVWVDANLHQLSITMLLTANRRQLSLVDCVSFAVCRQQQIQKVFAFDTHFSEQGFQLLSANSDT